MGRWICKRKAPFPLSDETVVNEDGSWRVIRVNPYLNYWCPDISVAGRFNHDLKLLTNGRETKSTVFYVTIYAAKKQGRSYNLSALLAEHLKYHFEYSAEVDDWRERNHKLLLRCVLGLNREAEMAGPLVICHLMGWGETFTSHHYVPIYWSSVEGLMKRTFPELRCVSHFSASCASRMYSHMSTAPTANCLLQPQQSKRMVGEGRRRKVVEMMVG